MRLKINFIILITLVFLLSILLQTAICTAGIAVIKLQDLKDSEKTIQVTGTGVYPDNPNFSIAQKRKMAERAATVDGYRKLLEQIAGVIVDSETTMQNYIVENDTVKTKVNGIVRGAKQVEIRHFDEGSAEVDLQITLGKDFYNFCQPYVKAQN